jgi:hypothetical protein
MTERTLEIIKSWEDVLPGDLLIWSDSDLVVEFSSVAQYGFSGTVRGANDLDYEDGMNSDTWTMETYNPNKLYDTNLGWRKIVTGPPERPYDPSQEPDDEDDV